MRATQPAHRQRIQVVAPSCQRRTQSLITSHMWWLTSLSSLNCLRPRKCFTFRSKIRRKRCKLLNRAPTTSLKHLVIQSFPLRSKIRWPLMNKIWKLNNRLGSNILRTTCKRRSNQDTSSNTQLLSSINSCHATLKTMGFLSLLRQWPLMPALI